MANTRRKKVKLAGVGRASQSSPPINGHEPAIRLQAARKYTARCSCGWRSRGTYPTSDAAKAAWVEYHSPDDDLFTSPEGAPSTQRSRRRRSPRRPT